MIGRLWRLLRRGRLERELDRELRFHVEAHAADLVRGGLAPDEARRRALIELGGVEQVKEAARDARGTRWIEELLADTRYALRSMARTPAFTVTALLTLAGGIGATTAVWSIMDALLLRPLPVERPAEVHAVRRDGLQPDNYLISHPALLRMRAVLPDTIPLAAMGSIASMYVITGDQPERAAAQAVTGNFFQTLGLQPAAGRLLTPNDDVTPGGHPVVVLGARFWQRQFGGSLEAIGRTVRVNGYSMSVVGVAPEGFSGLSVGSDVDLWIPASMQHETRYFSNASANNANMGQPWITQPGMAWLTLITRAAPGHAAAVQAMLDAPFRAALADELASLDAADREYGMREHVALESLARGFSSLRDTYRDPLRVLMASVAVVLLIACGNLAALLLTRGEARASEMALRASLGARRGRLVRQLLTESLALALAAGAAGVIIARLGAAALLRMAGSTRAVPLNVPLDGRLLAFALGLTIVTGLLFGLMPALRLSRVNVHDVIKTGTRVLGRNGHRLPLGRLLVIGQIALSLLLVTSAALFVRTFQNFIALDAGYDREQVVSARIDALAAGYTPDQLPALGDRLLAAVRAVPGVRSASLSASGLAGGSQRRSSFAVPGRELPPGSNVAQVNVVSQEFFSTVGMALLAGRGFVATDRDSSPQVAVLSESAALQLFGTREVIGARFGYGSPATIEVVGLVGDARVNFLKDDPPPVVFLSLAQSPHDYIGSIEARVSGASQPVVDGIRQAIASVDRGLPVREVVTLGTLLERGLLRERLLARLAAGLAGLGLMLAAVGLYGVMAYSVSRRRNEMGIRLALGAAPSSVAGIVLRDSLITVGAGLMLGGLLWLPLLGLTRRLVFGLSPHDPSALLAAALLLLSVTVAAALLPAWRAARTDPASAIRAD